MFSLARTQENLQMLLPQRRYGLANCATTTLYELECMMYISGLSVYQWFSNHRSLRLKCGRSYYNRFKHSQSPVNLFTGGREALSIGIRRFSLAICKSHFSMR